MKIGVKKLYKSKF